MLQGNVIVNQRRVAGAPFGPGSAANGLSVDGAGRIVLGQDVGAVGDPAVLLNNREIPMNGFSFALKDNFGVQPLGTYFLGDDAVNGNGTEIILRDNVPDIRITTLIGVNTNRNVFVVNGGAKPNFGFGDMGNNNKGLKLFLNDDTDNGYVDNVLHNSRFGVNIDPATIAAQFNPAFISTGDQGTNSETTLLRFGAVAAANQLAFRKTRGISPSTLTPVVAGDATFDMRAFAVANDNLYHGACRILGQVVSVGANFIEGNLLIQITDSAGVNANRFLFNGNSQFSVNTIAPNASAQMQIDSTTRGFAQPRMTTAQKNAIAAPLVGLSLFDTTLNQPSVYDGAWKSVLIGNDGAAAPALSAIGVPAQVYGVANANILGDPNAWGAITVNGTVYKIPLYT